MLIYSRPGVEEKRRGARTRTHASRCITNGPSDRATIDRLSSRWLNNNSAFAPLENRRRRPFDVRKARAAYLHINDATNVTFVPSLLPKANGPLFVPCTIISNY